MHWMSSGVWSYCGLVFSLCSAGFIIGAFFWLPSFLFFVFYCLGSIIIVYKEVSVNKDFSNFYNCESRLFSFWVFLLTEGIVFVTLFGVFLFFYEGESPISSPLGYSLAGSVCLLSSSVWITAWHNAVFCDLSLHSPHDDALRCIFEDSFLSSSFFAYPETRCGVGLKPHLVFLLLSVGFGLIFIYLQLVEFSFCSVNLVDSSGYSIFFCTVGLHFLHVCLGLIILVLYPFFFGASGINSYCNLSVWYWHFVDYVWLWVYIVFYFA